MNKQEFLAKLRANLTGMSPEDREERVNFYSEMIDDRMEEGWTEEQAIANLGSLDSILQQILSETPQIKPVSENVRPSRTRTLRAWEIVLLVLGSPLWMMLLLAFFMIVVSIYAVLWSVLLFLWAVEVSLAACALAGVICWMTSLAQGQRITGIAMLGLGIFCAGLAIFGFFGCKYITNMVLNFTKRIFLWIKSRFTKKERYHEEYI